ncbi:MAG: family ATPase [Actinomycetota bacterium]|nr:family ATPase [Actinomycetota bacterium]
MDAIANALRGQAVDLGAETRGPLSALRGCPQSVAFHAEGDVATHTEWVYDLACERAEAYLRDGGDPVQASTLRLAALLHDAGKPATTTRVADGVYASRGHDLAGAALFGEIAHTHPVVADLPLGARAGTQALIRDHMWAYAADRLSRGAALRMTHDTDPRLLAALWDCDARGRVCDDVRDVEDRVGYARLVLDDVGAEQPDRFGVLALADPARASSPRAWREVFRAVANGEITDVGAAAAALAAAERHSMGGSLTYTIGLPGLGKSTWAREVWQPATDGVVLSAEGSRRRDRRAATSQVLSLIPTLLARGADICVDATHLVRTTRDVLVAYAGRYGAAVHAAYFHGRLALALDRQRTRPSADAVPDGRVAAMTRALRWPTPDEYQTLTVVEPGGAMWDYAPVTRWLTSDEAARLAPVTAATWTGRVAEARRR